MEWLQLLCCTSNSKGLIYMRWGEVLINMSAIWFERGKNTKVQYRFSRRMKVERIFAFLENVVLKCNANTLLCFSQNWNLHYRLCKKHARKMGKMFNFLQDSLSRQFCLTASGEDFHTLTSRHNVFIKKKKIYFKQDVGRSATPDNKTHSHSDVTASAHSPQFIKTSQYIK